MKNMELGTPAREQESSWLPYRIHAFWHTYSRENLLSHSTSTGVSEKHLLINDLNLS